MPQMQRAIVVGGEVHTRYGLVVGTKLASGAVKQLKKKCRGGLDAAKTLLASGSGRSVSRLTSPFIGLLSAPVTRAQSRR
jgi:hypothetical protein